MPTEMTGSQVGSPAGARPSDHSATTTVRDNRTLITLTATQFFCSEGDGFAIVGIMRLGNLKSESRVRYTTVDHSGEGAAGQCYDHIDGELVFAPSEAFKEIRVVVHDDDQWGNTVEFSFDLLEEGLSGALLNRYLQSAVIQVLDNDAFPTNKYKDEVDAENWHAIPDDLLMIEYFKLNYSDPVVKKGTRKMIVLGSLHNIYFLLKLYVNVYLVDGVLKGTDEDLFVVKNKVASLWLIFLINVVPFCFLFFLDQRKFGWKVGGKSRAILQLSLLRRFMNYADESRDSVDKGDLVMAMARDVTKLVTDGYIAGLKLVNEFGKLLAILVFQLTAPIVFDKELRVATILIPTLGFPVLQLAFLQLRKEVTTDRFQYMNEDQDNFVDSVNHTLEHYGIVADYGMKTQYSNDFAKVIANLNKSIKVADWTMMNNLYFPKWVALIIVNIYIVWMGVQVGTTVTLGMFLAEANVFGQMGQAWGAIYKILLEMQTSYPALERITRLENLTTDMSCREHLSKCSRDKSKKWREKALEAHGGTVLNLDQMTIDFQDPKMRETPFGMPLNFSGHIKVNAGERIALVGKRGQGKATLLKLIGGAILPRTDSGDSGYFVPSHHRVLHVSLEPVFVKGGLMENLTFGCEHEEDRNEERVKTILKMLEVTDSSLEEDLQLSDLEHASFSQTEAFIYHLARAFVLNPTVLCIHKPTHAFDDQMTDVIMRVITTFVEDRGLCVRDSDLHGRFLRTCIFTSTEMPNVKYADHCIHVSKTTGIRTVNKEDVTADMLH